MSSLKKISSAVRSIFDYAHGTNFWVIFLFLFLYQVTLGYIRMEFIATDAIYAQHVEAQLSNKYGDLMDEFEEDIEDFDDFEEETFADLQSFKPFSLYSLFPSDTVATWMVYPLKTLNLFEVIFVFFVAVGVTHATPIKFYQSISIVSITYVLLLLTLMVIRIYLSLMFSRL